MHLLLLCPWPSKARVQAQAPAATAAPHANAPVVQHGRQVADRASRQGLGFKPRHVHFDNHPVPRLPRLVAAFTCVQHSCKLRVEQGILSSKERTRGVHPCASSVGTLEDRGDQNQRTGSTHWLVLESILVMAATAGGSSTASSAFSAPAASAAVAAQLEFAA